MTKLPKDRLLFLNRFNNVDIDKVTLFNATIKELILLIDSTYLGDELTETTYNKIKHFDWCWKKVTNQPIDDNDDYYNFREYFMNSFYNVVPKNKGLIMKMTQFWETHMNTAIPDKETYEVFLDNYKKLTKILD
jgi:hypothetical protein